MLVVLKVMFRESLIFFLLLFVVLVGFLQAFMGLDIAEDQVMNDIGFVMQAMLNAIMQSPEFEGFDNFAVSVTASLLSHKNTNNNSPPLASSSTTSSPSSSW